MNNAPYKGVANQLSQYGRYGDSMLVHMNPIEVQGLAAMSPTGKLTRNPVTGQPEAFLPFLAPLLGSMLGSSLLTGTGAALLGGAGLSSAAAGAIGSGLATTLATGDLEQGIMSGLTGFGIGSALGGLSDAVKAGTDVATKAATEGVTQAATDAATQGVADAATGAVTEGFGAAVNPIADAAAAVPVVQPEMLEGLGAIGAETASTAAPKFIPPELTAAERFAQPFTEPTKFIGELTKPSSFLPMYVGETGRLAREQELMGRGSARAFEEEQEAERQKTLGQIGSVFDQVRAAYPVGYKQGGQVAHYAVGGGIENSIRQAAERAGYGGEYGDFSGSLPYNIPSAENVQLSLRGQYALTPPPASYSALDVGGEGYMPGMAPEFQYFSATDPNAPPPAPPPPPPPPPPPTGIVNPPPGTIAGGGGDGLPGDFEGAIPEKFNFFGNLGYFEPPPTPAYDLSAYGDMSNYGDLAAGIGSLQPDAYSPAMEPVSGPTEIDMDRINVIRNLMSQSYNPMNFSSLTDTARNQVEDVNAPLNYEFSPFDFSTLSAETANVSMMPEERGFDINQYLYPDQEFSLQDTMAEGGMTEAIDQDLLRMTVAAIRGEIENADEVIRQFVDQYGPEMFSELRNQVLQQIVPGAQTEGMVQGQGGGQDDMVEGMIGSQQRVAVSPGEYIIPADVVSLAGGGYSGNGAEFFDSLVNDIRQKTMGTKEQIKPYQRGVSA